MGPHPVEHEESLEPGHDPGAPNPTRLPVEPEFGSMDAPAEGEDPAGVLPPA